MISSPRQPTLADIAARAGTTIPTVSKVLNGRSDVSEGTRRRIMDLVAETGYRRRGSTAARPASARPAGDRRLIDLVISGVAGGWANQVLIGVESAAAAAGLELVVTVAGGQSDGNREDWVTRLLARSSAGAVLALVDASTQQLAMLTAAGIPVVLLDPVDRPPEGIASVGATNWPAGRDVAEHLLGLGHRRFGVLAWSKDLLYSRARVDGFCSAVGELAGEESEISTLYVDGRLNAVQAAARLLDSADRPTAVFAGADTLALGVLQVAADRGIAIPDDLSVVGFDDVPEAKWAGLSTVRQPIAEMGAAALRLLLRQRDADRRLPREELATTLVLRASTAAPARHP
ncbi:LacI family DNA-binding transcriptional regulator [Microlunatus soli]|uniref:Transcriptional regulator, LacI family n=1 Tax=Microlunatus soli TaxID=630515 RepID=A0A1H1Z765_9ACTN|nr:LacI family DNA-binding transcriptional regulator [Microlunatus soli]SDT29362.1 transcriptional regulator, LacI family [Microlunatus soli]